MPEKKAPAVFVLPFVVAVLFGVLAGGVGGLMAGVYLLPPLVPTDAAFARRLIVETRPVSAHAETVANAVSLSMVRLVSSRALKEISAGTFVPEDAVIGKAMAVTGDGWLVTDGDLADELQGAVAITSDGARHTIETAVADLGSGAVFLRINAANLAVTSFGDSEDVRVGDGVLLVTARGTAITTHITSRGSSPADLAHAITSSETMTDRLRVSRSLSRADRGTPVINRNGELVGILSLGDSAVPVASFKDVLAGVFRTGAVHRPFLGVHSIDLSLVGGIPNETSGARITAGAGKQAVLRGSPAAEAGIKDGDVILGIEGVNLSPGENLSEALAEFDPGVRIELLVRRGAETSKVVVTLGDTAEEE